ncbi:MAG TPA: hypothetical protein VFX13_01960 [Gaiellales bacterium]|nr:hypothetical protein [Gaiellales bacterium]
MLDVSELARGLAQLVPTLASADREQLARLLATSVEAPSAGLIRRARLGLLIDILGRLAGELVDVPTYEAERANRAQANEVWPAATTLIRLFGTWFRAQAAAIDLAFRGTGARRPSSLQHTGSRPGYTAAEVREVLIEVRRVLGAWPLSGEYFEYRRLRRWAARLTGSPEPRLPSMTPLNRLYGGYEQALRDAQSEVGELPHGPTNGDRRVSKHSKRGAPEEGLARLTPAAQHWWRVVQGLGEPDRRFLWMALQGPAKTVATAVTDHCQFALRACADAVPDGRPSRKRYETWRSGQSRPDECPGSSTIRERFGSWAAALEAIGATPTPDVLAYRLRGRNPAFTIEELIRGIAVCGCDWKALHPGRPLRQLDYKRWAAAEMASASPRFERLALNDKTITQHMTWAEALVAAGHADLLGLNAMVFTRCSEWSDDDLFDWLREAAAEFDEEECRMSSRGYDEWAREIETHLRASDPTATVPHSPQMIRRFGDWLNTLLAAELITPAEHRRRSHAGGWTKEGLAIFLRRVLDKYGDAMTMREYDEWRENELARADTSKAHGCSHEVGIPSEGLVTVRLGDGSWRKAKAAALGLGK